MSEETSQVFEGIRRSNSKPEKALRLERASPKPRDHSIHEQIISRLRDQLKPGDTPGMTGEVLFERFFLRGSISRLMVA